MLSLGTLILLSYYLFIFYPSININKWWFGLNKNKLFMRIFYLTASLAAIGFVYYMYYLCFYLDESQFPNKSDYNDASDKLLIETSIVLVASLLWAPLTYGYLKTNYNIYKVLSSIVLGVTGFASVAISYFIYDMTPDSIERTLAIIGVSLFSFHTIFIDFGVWNKGMWKL